MKKLLCGLLLLPFAIQAVAEPAEPSVHFRLRRCTFTLAPDTAAAPIAIRSPASGVELVTDSAEAATSVIAENRDGLDARIAVRTPIGLDLELKHSRGTADLSGVEVRQLKVVQKGGSLSLRALKPSAALTGRIDCQVSRGSLNAERLGNLNPAFLSLSITGGRAVADFRGEKPLQLEGIVRLKGGKAVLLFPENAQVSVAAAPGALFAARTRGFLTDGKGGFWREGKQGGSIRLLVESQGGALTLLTAPEEALLEEALEEKPRVSADLSLVNFSEISNWIRYNRVEGLYLGLNYDSRYVAKDPYSLYARAGYAIHHHLVQYELGVRADLEQHFRLPATLTLCAGKKADSEDRWIMSDNENSLQMLLFGDDYRDYFSSDFKSLGGVWQPVRFLTLEGSATRAYYKSLGTMCRFSLLGLDTLTVRWNPPVQERRDHVITANCRYDNTPKGFPRHGADCRARAEYSGGRIQSQFTYRRIVTDLRGYYAFPPGLELCGRLYTGEVVSKTSNADIATQKLFDCNGAGTIRGLPFRDHPGLWDKNRLLVANAEARYLIAPPCGLQPSFIFDRMPAMLACVYADFGRSWNTEDYGHSNLDFNNLLAEIQPSRFYKSVGFGLSDRNEHIRIDLARTFYWEYPWPWDCASIRFGRTF